MSTSTPNTITPRSLAINLSQHSHLTESDVTFRSCDGVLFHIDKRYLDISSTDFPLAPDNACSTPVIPLEEAASTLDLLFQFCLPGLHPDLQCMEFNAFMAIAEAAEKYRVFSAMNICGIRMVDHLYQHASEILVYAANHGYPDVLEVAAPLAVLEKSGCYILPKIPSELVIPWVVYHERWQQVARDAVSYHDTWKKNFVSERSFMGKIECKACDSESVHNFVLGLLTRLGGDLTVLQDLGATFDTSTLCKHIAPSFSSWRMSVEESIKNIPTFRKPTSKPDIIPLDLVKHSNAGDPDITIRSSDGIFFQVHKSNLALSSSGFAPSEFASLDEIVQLTETSTTLNLLFKFCYPERHPDVTTLEFDALESLAEAAEKYEVYSAVSVCKLRMRKLLPRHADGILAYAAKHNYRDILDVAAPSMLRIPLSEAVCMLPQNIVAPWVRYHEQWDQVWKDAVYQALKCWETDVPVRCSSCGEKIDVYAKRLVNNLGCGVARLMDVDELVGPDGCCSRVQENFSWWRTLVETNVANIRSFETFL